MPSPCSAVSKTTTTVHGIEKGANLMSNTNNQQVLALLNGAGKPAPEMTKGLSVLGDGNMADGLIALWENGQ